jgi:2-polyprenyl-3-methyl-5-hydroxy-6-metoxy-1,4-benzoquinol methylase
MGYSLGMEYGDAEFKADLEDPEFGHTESRERFQAFYNELGLGPARLVEYPVRMNWVQIREGANVLELGCHNGYNLVRWATTLNATCVGVDISEPLLEIARQRCIQDEVVDKVKLVKSFIEDYETTESFTDIVLTETLEHVQEAQEVVNKAVQLMGEGTRLWITVPTRRWGNSSHVRGIRAGTLSSMLQDAGLDVSELIKIEEVMHQGEYLTRCLAVKR